MTCDLKDQIVPALNQGRFEWWNETSIYVSIKHTRMHKHTHIFLLSWRRCALRMLWGALFRVAISKAAVSASPPPSSSYVMMFSLISSSSTGDWVSRFCLRNDSESAATTIAQNRVRKTLYFHFPWIKSCIKFKHMTDTFIQSNLPCINFFPHFMHSLGIEPMTLVLLAPCSTV